MLIGLAHLTDEGRFDVLRGVKLLDPVKRVKSRLGKELSGIHSLTTPKLGNPGRHYGSQGLRAQLDLRRRTYPL